MLQLSSETVVLTNVQCANGSFLVGHQELGLKS